MALDPSIIGGIQPLASPQQQDDVRAQRALREQEQELRRMEILARRDELIERTKARQNPHADPLKQKQALEYNIFRGEVMADVLEKAKANPAFYPHARQYLAQTVGDVSDLPEQYDEAAIGNLITSGRSHIQQAKGQLQKIETVDAQGNTVQRFVVPTEGAEYPTPTKPASTTNPTEASLALLAAQGDANAAAALKIIRQQHPVGGGAGPVDPLVDVVGPDGKRILVPRSRAAGMTPGAALSAAGGDTAQDRQRKARTTAAMGFLGRLNELREKINTKMGPAAGATGLVRRGAAAIGMDPDVAEYERERAAGGRALAVAIMGAQNLSDQDAKAWADMLPGATVDKETASRLMRQVETMLNDTTGGDAAPALAVSHGKSAPAAKTADGWTDLGGGVRIRKKQ